ncbi:MAG: hypothetical protein ABSC94_31540 [Polyangiaceae bacterium]|jgi:hypothetical protein
MNEPESRHYPPMMARWFAMAALELRNVEQWRKEFADGRERMSLANALRDKLQKSRMALREYSAPEFPELDAKLKAVNAKLYEVHKDGIASCPPGRIAYYSHLSDREVFRLAAEVIELSIMADVIAGDSGLAQYAEPIELEGSHGRVNL